MKNTYDKTSFSFSYNVKDVKSALDKFFNTKNENSWSDYEKYTIGCLDLECSFYRDEENILLNARESAILGLYSKGKPGKKKGAKKDGKKIKGVQLKKS